MSQIVDILENVAVREEEVVQTFHSPKRKREKAIISSGSLLRDPGSDRAFFTAYGRPSYILPHNASEFRYITFIFSPDCYKLITRVYALDSGGVSRYADSSLPMHYRHRKFFFIGSSIEAISKAITLFWTNHKNYLDKIPNQHWQYSEPEHDVWRWYGNNVVATREQTNSEYDPPSHTFEIQLTFDDDMFKYLECIIMPRSQLKEKLNFLIELERRWNRKIAVRHPSVESQTADNASRAAIESCALQYVRDRQYHEK